MQLAPPAIDIDAGFVSMSNRSHGQLCFLPLLEVVKPFIGFTIKVEQGAGADGDAHLIPELIAHVLIGKQLELGQVHCSGLI